MKILFLNTFKNVGGATQACNRIYHALQTYTDYTLSIINQFDETNLYTNWRNWPGLFRLLREKVQLIPVLKNKNSKFEFDSASVGKSFRKNHQIEEADIIHMHWISQGFVSLEGLSELAAKGKPIVHTLHDMWAFTGGCFYAGECDHYMKNCGHCPFLKGDNADDVSHKTWLKKESIYKHSNIKWVCPSIWLYNAAKESSLGQSNEIFYIPYPVDTDKYKPIDRQKILKEYNLDPDKFYILFGAHNISDKRKGLNYLIEALEDLKSNNSGLIQNSELVLFGKCNDTSILNHLPIPFHYKGFIKDSNELIKLYNAADIFAMPSVDDNLPNMILESLACGTPVVSFNMGGIPDMISHDENGFLAEYRNPSSLATGLNYFFQNRDQMEIFSVKARKKAETEFSIKKVAKQYADLYNEIMDK